MPSPNHPQHPNRQSIQPFTVTHFHHDDAYEVTWDGDAATVILYRACFDGRGEVVPFLDLPIDVQHGILKTVKKSIEHQKKLEREQQDEE